MLISQFIIDLNISHDEFKIIINKKKDHDNQKNATDKGGMTVNALP